MTEKKIDYINCKESNYLIARDENSLLRQKELLCDMLAPIFIGTDGAKNETELRQLFLSRYGIDVQGDFCEGDNHYEEYLEARQAIAEGMMVYGGGISFDDTAMAELAEKIWERLEKDGNLKFRRINTMLEE